MISPSFDCEAIVDDPLIPVHLDRQEHPAVPEREEDRHAARREARGSARRGAARWGAWTAEEARSRSPPGARGPPRAAHRCRSRYRGGCDAAPAKYAADLLVDARNDAGHGLDALREDRDHEVGAVGQDDAPDEVVDVVGVARLRPDARSPSGASARRGARPRAPSPRRASPRVMSRESSASISSVPAGPAISPRAISLKRRAASPASSGCGSCRRRGRPARARRRPRRTSSGWRSASRKPPRREEAVDDVALLLPVAPTRARRAPARTSCR